MESIIKLEKNNHRNDYNKLIKSACKGDRESLSILINENIEYLYKVAFMYLKNEDKTLDAIQECSYRAFLNIKRLNDLKVFKSWLTRILINICVDEIRKDKKVVEFKFEFEIEEERGVTIEEKLDLYNAIDKLNIDYRTVIILKYFNDLSIEEGIRKYCKD